MDEVPLAPDVPPDVPPVVVDVSPPEVGLEVPPLVSPVESPPVVGIVRPPPFEDGINWQLETSRAVKGINNFTKVFFIITSNILSLINLLM